MLRHSLRVRLLLPVLGLVVVIVVALTLALASVEADRVQAEADEAIRQQSTAVQSLFSVTRSVMLERVHGAMNLLRQESDALGRASSGAPVGIGGRTATDLLFGAESQSGNYALVDGVTSVLDGTATVFSRTGDEFVRVATNVRSADGNRAVGTVLNPDGQVIEQIRKSQGFYGVVDILGTPYVTGYEPIVAGDAIAPIGIWYVGYRTDLDALEAVITQARVLESGFVAIFDSTGQLRFQSRTGNTTDPVQIEQIARERPDTWVVTSEEIPDWGFTLVSAFPKRDINRVILAQSLWIGGIGLFVCILLFGLLSMLIFRRVLRPIQRLTAVAEELSVGKWNHTIGEVELKDEIGSLARAISRLSNSVRLAMERLSKR
ncbi:Cache 3/Cache 2 fusion domain-containing protein [Luteimonas sp. 3794]|uniref:Cache 3/Cache 2 fusion domain-containing protein n=1 Tax=Luteimonas sp. 3794 TaxID=2817730 RepID=UPI00286B1310|nr:Cache 3/Cache 2 fusion domain-containing protein [Luteimonas sp. 3794]